MKIWTLSISKSDLVNIPEPERAFFVQSGHLRNEIQMLVKFSKWSGNFQYSDEIRLAVSVAQSLMLTRLLAGKLHEAWKLVNDAYLGEGLDETIGNQISKPGQHAYNALIDYFFDGNKKDNLGRTRFAKLRDRFSFHYDRKGFRKELSKIEEDEELLIYVAENGWNTYYDLSEVIIAKSMLNSLDRGEPEEVIEHFVTELGAKAFHFLNFIDACAEYFVKTYMIKRFDECEETQLNNAPSSGEVIIPFFVEGMF